MERFLLVCLGGAVGTGARYLIALWSIQRFGPTFPVGTLIVNLAGCFLVAALMHAALAQSWSDTTRHTVTLGFLGGLTTYSSFNYETTRLFETTTPAMAALNVAATLIGGFVFGWLGIVTARAVLGR